MHFSDRLDECFTILHNTVVFYMYIYFILFLTREIQWGIVVKIGYDDEEPSSKQTHIIIASNILLG